MEEDVKIRRKIPHVAHLGELSKLQITQMGKQRAGEACETFRKKTREDFLNFLLYQTLTWAISALF